MSKQPLNWRLIIVGSAIIWLVGPILNSIAILIYSIFGNSYAIIKLKVFISDSLSFALLRDAILALCVGFGISTIAKSRETIHILAAWLVALLPRWFFGFSMLILITKHFSYKNFGEIYGFIFVTLIINLLIMMLGGFIGLFFKSTTETFAPEVEAEDSHIPAGFWIRFAAKTIDGFFVGLICLVINDTSMIQYFAFFMIADLLYNTISVGIWGMTIGKYIAGIKIIGEQNDKVGYGRSLLRAAALNLSYALMFLGFFMVLFNKKKKAMHDYIAGSRVIYPTTVSLKRKVIVIMVIPLSIAVFNPIYKFLNKPQYENRKVQSARMTYDMLKFLKKLQLKKSPKDISSLLSAIRDSNPMVRYYALISLDNSPEASLEALPNILPMLNDADSSVRSRTQNIIRHTLGAKSLPLLVEYLNDEKLNNLALEAIKLIGPDASEAVPKLIQLFLETNEFETSTLNIIQSVLAQIGKSAIPPLKEIAFDSQKSLYIREQAIESLTKTRIYDEIIPLLKSLLLYDPNSAIRSKAADCLYYLGKEASSALPELYKATLDGDRHVRQMAEFALKKIEEELNQVDKLR